MNPPDGWRALTGRQTPHGLEQRVLARARDAGFRSQDRIVVGFSGGRDSLALAATLHWASRVLGIESLLVHVDHGLRSSSGDEARQAAALADALGMKFLAVAVDASPIMTHPGVGMEEAARRERYRVLFEAGTQYGARAIATAHHQGDQAETVLLHLLRGGGVHGAAGMAERSPLPYAAPGKRSNISLESENHPEDPMVWLWRPLLSEPRVVISAYVQEIGLRPIEDPSNDDLRLRRNAVRHEVLPLLEKHFTGANAALARYSALAAEDDRALEDLAVAIMEEVVAPGGLLAATPLGGRPRAIQRRVIRRWLEDSTGMIGLTAARTDAVLTLLGAKQGGQSIEIGEGWTVRLERGMLRVDKRGNQRQEVQ